MDLNPWCAVWVGQVLIPDVVQPLTKVRRRLRNHTAQADVIVAFVKISLQPLVPVAHVMHW